MSLAPGTGRPRSGPFRCTHPVVMGDNAYQWPPGTAVTWYLDPTRTPPTLTADQTVKAIAAGTGHWPAACGVAVAQVADPAQARLVIGFTEIDGPYNVLGETELPAEGRADVTHTMRLDVSEPWTEHSLEWVVAHEFGHGIGVGHSPAGVTAVMSAYYNPALLGLMPWDEREGQLRYGPPSTPTVAATPATQPGPSTAPAATGQEFEVFWTAPAAGDYRLVLKLEMFTVPK